MLGLEIVANDNPASNPREPSTLGSKQTFHDRIGLVIMINDMEICSILCESTTQQKCCYFSTTSSKIFVPSSKFAVASISPSHPSMAVWLTRSGVGDGCRGGDCVAGSGNGSGGDSVRVGEVSVLLSSVNSSKRMHIYVCYLCICRNAFCMSHYQWLYIVT